jgi:hypothetical protein
MVVGWDVKKMKMNVKKMKMRM